MANNINLTDISFDTIGGSMRLKDFPDTYNRDNEKIKAHINALNVAMSGIGNSYDDAVAKMRRDFTTWTANIQNAFDQRFEDFEASSGNTSSGSSTGAGGTSGSLADYAKKSELNAYIKTNVADNRYQAKGNYVTNSYLTSNYYSKNDVDTRLSGMESSYVRSDSLASTLSGYVKVEGMTQAIRNINIPSLEGYAKESWVNSQGFLKEHQSLDDYALKSQLPDLTEYAKKSEIPVMSNYATKTYVTNQLSALASSGSVDLTGYAEESWVDENYATKTYVAEQYVSLSGLENKVRTLLSGEGYIKRSDVEAIINELISEHIENYHSAEGNTDNPTRPSDQPGHNNPTQPPTDEPTGGDSEPVVPDIPTGGDSEPDVPDDDSEVPEESNEPETYGSTVQINTVIPPDGHENDFEKETILSISENGIEVDAQSRFDVDQNQIDVENNTNIIIY